MSWPKPSGTVRERFGDGSRRGRERRGGGSAVGPSRWSRRWRGALLGASADRWAVGRILSGRRPDPSGNQASAASLLRFPQSKCARSIRVWDNRATTEPSSQYRPCCPPQQGCETHERATRRSAAWAGASSRSRHGRCDQRAALAPAAPQSELAPEWRPAPGGKLGAERAAALCLRADGGMGVAQGTTRWAQRLRVSARLVRSSDDQWHPGVGRLGQDALAPRQRHRRFRQDSANPRPGGRRRGTGTRAVARRATRSRLRLRPPRSTRRDSPPRPSDPRKFRTESSSPPSRVQGGDFMWRKSNRAGQAALRALEKMPGPAASVRTLPLACG